MATVQAKAWYASRLIWLGVAQMALGISEVLSTTPILEGSTVAGIAVTIAGALTFLLRLVTDKPVASSAGPVSVT